MTAPYRFAVPVLAGLSFSFVPAATGAVMQEQQHSSYTQPMITQPAADFKKLSACMEQAVLASAPEGAGVTSALFPENPRQDYHAAILPAKDGLLGLTTGVLNHDGEDLLVITSVRDVDASGDTDAPEDSASILFLDPLTLETAFDFVQPGENVDSEIRAAVQNRALKTAETLRACALKIS